MDKNRFHFGVVVGINRYPGMTHLRFAKGDAEAFANWLLDSNGGGLLSRDDDGRLLEDGHVITITVDDEDVPDGIDFMDAHPIPSDVFKALRKIRKAIENHIENYPEDWSKTRIYYYVSGHGFAPDVRDAALLFANAGESSYCENISCDCVLSFFGKCRPFHEVVVFADCCRVDGRGPMPLGMVPEDPGRKNDGDVVQVFGCATRFGEVAWESEDPDLQRGYFTKALLEGLKGQAEDPYCRGEINSNTLANYVKARVKDLTEKQQIPTMSSDPAAPIIFRLGGDVIKSATHKIRIEFSTHCRCVVTLRDNADKVLREHRTVDGDLIESLGNGLYEIRAEDGSNVKFVGDGFFRVLGADLNVKL